MIGFYHGLQKPGDDAHEGIYFINDNNNYSIYRKANGQPAVKYGDTNQITSEHLTSLWTQIGEQFVAKSFTIAGLDMQDDIGLKEMQDQLKLQALAYKSNATGTLSDYVVEVNGVNYTPTGNVEVKLGFNQIAMVSTGKITPEGIISVSVVPQGGVSLSKDNTGFAVSGKVIKQITGVGALPSYTPAEYTAPTLSQTSNNFTTQGTVSSVNGECLVLSAAPTAAAVASVSMNEGQYVAAKFSPGALPTMDDVSVMTGVASTNVSEPIFTGDKIKASFTGVESEIDASFEGTEKEISVSGQYSQAYVDSVEFTGDSYFIQPTLEKEEKTITVQ